MNKIIVGTGVLIVDKHAKDRLILGKRKSSLGFMEWSLPGGKKERNEDIFVTAYREVKEETGLIIDNLTFLFESECVLSGVLYKTSHYLSKVDLSNFSNCENDEFFEWSVFSIYDMPTNIFSFSRETLDYYIKNIMF